MYGLSLLFMSQVAPGCAILELRLETYSNPEARTENGNKCDSPSYCDPVTNVCADYPYVHIYPPVYCTITSG